MIYIKSFVYISIFIILIVSCGSSGTSLTDILKKDAQTRSVLIIKNASKITMQSVEIAKKSSIYKQEILPKNLDCIKLGFSNNKTSRDINLSLVSYKKWTNKELICEINDYKQFDKNISGEFNTIFILNN